ncbi:hypothetical protein Dimus_038994 [Dionaea muscipula]
MRVLKAYWSNAVVMVTYLVNRMPSSILNEEISVSLLFPTDPLHHLPLCVFGCTCFVHVLDSVFDQLDPRSRRCIFLGVLSNPEWLLILLSHPSPRVCLC